MFSSKNVREKFHTFFEEKEHTRVNSAPVIPIDDPTLLFTNAGMNQFKDEFIGNKISKFKRIVNSQKCIRAGGKHNDLEEVGKDGYHHTFFEMLGNWSFGDFYKKEIIEWSWELLTDVWKLPKDKLYATVFREDKEAYDLWKSCTDIDEKHILYFDEKDNFWEMGDTGPCGPCSEIHIDLGEKFCDKEEEHVCGVNGECGRYIELWNLVFIQYFRDKSGKLNPLENRFVDTGAGLERICQVLQKKESNYETDLFMPIISEIEKLSKVEYNKSVPHRVIADHIRALCFAIADGGLPSNEGRGYVLRRILRRGARFGRLLGLKKPFMYKLVDVVVDLMGHHFSELISKKAHITLIIKSEEERFNTTLDNGLEKFNEIVAKSDNKIISGKDAFTLYDTYGFPLDLTCLLAEEKNFFVDEKEFSIEMEEQRKRARSAANFKQEDKTINWIEVEKGETEFVGYTKNSEEVKILKYAFDEDDFLFVLNKTPFYAEQGGQTFDVGFVKNSQLKISVFNVQKLHGTIVHYGKIDKGAINQNPLTAVIDKNNRKQISINHTTTHILQAVLRKVIGEHVQQKGSSVHADSLRFDFTHFKSLTDRELQIIENLVNEEIRNCAAVTTEIMSIDEAKKSGAMALFGEKYGDNVRVVNIGSYSKELCGGTHLNFTGEIGLFKILHESSVAAGVRRIEAVTGERALEYFNKKENELSSIGELLNVQQKNIMIKLEKVLQENKDLKNTIDKLKTADQSSAIDAYINDAVTINEFKVISQKVEAGNVTDLKNIGDLVKDKLDSGIAVFISSINDKVSIICLVTDDLKKKYPAGKIIRPIAQIVDGNGGGRPDMAMAGGKDISKIDEAVDSVIKIIQDM